MPREVFIVYIMLIKIITYNILDAGNGRTEFIYDVLQAAQADLIFLQEVSDPEPVRGFANRLQMEYFVAVGNTWRNIGLLSRFPIILKQSWHPFPPVRHAILEAVVEYAPNKKLGLVGVHLTPYFAWPFELWRIWELKIVLDRANALNHLPTVIAGDFNAIAPGDHVRLGSLPRSIKLMLLLQGNQFLRKAIGQITAAGYKDCFRTICSLDGFTLPTPNPNARLDYIFANSALAPTIKACQVVTKPDTVHRASDHYPLAAVFDLPA